MTQPDWQQIEADFRYWAFYRYYQGPYANVHSNTLRFCLSLLASAEPIRDRKAVIEWHRHYKKKKAQAEFKRITARSLRRQFSHLQNGKES